MNIPAVEQHPPQGIPKKGEQTMLVKAKWNVRDASGWHKAGEVFNTDADLGDAVEVLDAPKKARQKPVEIEPEPAEKPAEEKPKTQRRKR